MGEGELATQPSHCSELCSSLHTFIQKDSLLPGLCWHVLKCEDFHGRWHVRLKGLGIVWWQKGDTLGHSPIVHKGRVGPEVPGVPTSFTLTSPPQAPA